MSKKPRGSVYHQDWKHLEGGPVEYAVTGNHRLTYWLRLGAEVHKVTRATPTGYDDVARALRDGKRAIGYEIHCFGSAALAHATGPADLEERTREELANGDGLDVEADQ